MNIEEKYKYIRVIQKRYREAGKEGKGQLLEEMGAITGWSFGTEIPVKNKLKDIPKSVLTGIPGVLQAGQWAYTPSGVPTAMLTGWHAAQEVIKGSRK